MPTGPFDLLFQNQYFNGWPMLRDRPGTVVLSFPVEGWAESAAVLLTQDEGGEVRVDCAGAGDHDAAAAQALAAMSLDVDGSRWPQVGERDPVIGAVQRRYRYMRPSMFNSPYEAAAAFIIGHRISIATTRKIRAAMARDLGVSIQVGGESFPAFPDPHRLLDLESYAGINRVKIERLHAVARAALDGSLDRAHLRSLPEQDALERLRTLSGVGEFFAQGILQRGAGRADGSTTDEMTLHAIRTAYDLPADTPPAAVLAHAEAWQPYRMWATVLLNVRVREDGPPLQRRHGR